MHTDWLPRPAGDPFHAVTALVLLDAFTPGNGATRLVPGSHLRPGQVPRQWAAPGPRHPEEIVVEAPAGTVLVFNGHLWHAGTCHRSGAPRRALQCQYVALDSLPPGDAPAEEPLGS